MLRFRGPYGQQIMIACEPHPWTSNCAVWDLTWSVMIVPHYRPFFEQWCLIFLRAYVQVSSLFLKARLKQPTHLASVHGIPCYAVLPQAIKNILPALGKRVCSLLSFALQTIGVAEFRNGTNCCNNDLLHDAALVFAAFWLPDCTTAIRQSLETNGTTTWGGT